MQNVDGGEELGGQPNAEVHDPLSLTPDLNVISSLRISGNPQSTLSETPKITPKSVSRRIFNSEKEMDKLTEEIRKLDEMYEGLEEDVSTTTEKQIIQRDIRTKRREFATRLSELLMEKHNREYRQAYAMNKVEKKREVEEQFEKDMKGKQFQDELILIREKEGKPGEKAESYLTYCRNLNLCEKYMKAIKEAYAKIKEAHNENRESKTTVAKEHRQVDINTQVIS